MFGGWAAAETPDHQWGDGSWRLSCTTAAQPTPSSWNKSTHTRLWECIQRTISKYKADIIYTARCEITYTLICSSLVVEQAVDLQKWTISVINILSLRVAILPCLVNDCVSLYHRLGCWGAERPDWLRKSRYALRHSRWHASVSLQIWHNRVAFDVTQVRNNLQVRNDLLNNLIDACSRK